ncbi:iron uptake transporter permease EfeU [Streptomyces sp. Go-475]|uniref:iron uptake transporter permease EfeU n=1 Tax=Streptomyces sp. Go-475 TaxID=2072505 RepID=UPI000DEFB208|nr:iron uptake transporter permease EfeU [Streptomyces sp. Go-475]AXE83964.1 Ferrous iron permease EfeU [Streptomyces sp. Go-475]
MWDDAFPSFLIGLREGLEAGLIVSVLVATLVRADAKSRLPQVWTGVLAAIALSLSFGAVLTFTAASLSTTAQEAFGGTLSIVAVAFVTAMVFWMRRSARNLAGEIKEKVTEALAMGAGVLVLTSFLAVGREGLETALFLWTTARAANESAGPLTGAGVGLVLAAGLCWGLYRRVLRINLTRFFTVTGAVLVVIAAGVLGYGLRDLQEGGVLPGGTAYAFDLSGSMDAGSWYSTLLQGVLNLTPTMTWLQVAGYAGYLAVVMTLFVRGVSGVRTARGAGAAGGAGVAPDGRAVAAGPVPAEPVEAAARSAAVRLRDLLRPRAAAPQAEAGAPVPRPSDASGEGEAAAPLQPSTPPRPPARRRPAWLVPVAVVVVPAVLAGLVVALARPKPSGGETVAVSETDCGQGFTAPRPGRQTFQMRNTGDKTSEVYLIDPATHAVYGEIEGLAPGTTRDLVATVAGGSYAWRCVPTDGKAVTSKAVRVAGAAGSTAVVPVSERDLAAPLKAYRAYVDRGLATLVRQTRKLDDDIRSGHLGTARADWLTAHRTYASLGAAYGTFADFDQKINGRPDGLPGGVRDKDFTGFHRVEYGLWHGQSAAQLKGPAQQLADNAEGLWKAFPHQDFDPSDLPLRAHEILENTLQFELTGDTDQGSGTGLATADANLAGTRELLTVLRPLLTSRAPRLLPTVDADIARLQALLDSEHRAGRWTPVARLDRTAKARIDGATGQLLEDLSPVPDLLEIRKSA